MTPTRQLHRRETRIMVAIIALALFWGVVFSRCHGAKLPPEHPRLVVNYFGKHYISWPYTNSLWAEREIAFALAAHKLTTNYAQYRVLGTNDGNQIERRYLVVNRFTQKVIPRTVQSPRSKVQGLVPAPPAPGPLFKVQSSKFKVQSSAVPPPRELRWIATDTTLPTFRFQESSNLVTWTDLPWPAEALLVVTNTGPMRFFRAFTSP